MPDKPGIDGRVMRLFDGYVHGQITRREFLDRAAAFTASGVAAALLSSLNPDYALARQIDPDDESISVGYKKYASPKSADVNHGFHNDTTPRYHEKSAELAWQRTVKFFADHLGLEPDQ